MGDFAFFGKSSSTSNHVHRKNFVNSKSVTTEEGAFLAHPPSRQLLWIFCTCSTYRQYIENSLASRFCRISKGGSWFFHPGVVWRNPGTNNLEKTHLAMYYPPPQFIELICVILCTQEYSSYTTATSILLGGHWSDHAEANERPSQLPYHLNVELVEPWNGRIAQQHTV